MSSVSTFGDGNFNALGMGNMGDGGGQNFYMDGDFQDEQPEDNQRQSSNPELVFVDQGKETERNQNRQFLENLITGVNGWIDPWSTPPSQRSEDVVRNERESIMAYRYSKLTAEQHKKRKRMFIINA